MARRLQADFDASLQELWQGEPWHQALVRTSRSGNSWKYYTLQLGLDPLLTMYEATRHQPYLQFALALCQNMVGAANQDRDGDGPPEWDGRRGEGPMPDPPDVLLQDFQGAGPIIRAARIVLTDRQLKAKYGPQATPIAT